MKSGSRILLSAFCAVVFVFGTILNSALLLIIFRSRSLRQRFSSMYLTSLLITQLAACLYEAPYYFISLVADLPLPKESDFQTACRISMFVTYLLSFSKILNLTLMSLDRYIAIIHPFIYSRIVSRTKVVVSISFIWVQCLAFAIPIMSMESWAFYEGKCGYACGLDWKNTSLIYILVCAVLNIALPSLIMLGTNVSVFITARRQQKKIAHQTRQSCPIEVTRDRDGILTTVNKSILNPRSDVVNDEQYANKSQDICKKQESECSKPSLLRDKADLSKQNIEKSSETLMDGIIENDESKRPYECEFDRAPGSMHTISGMKNESKEEQCMPYEIVAGHFGSPRQLSFPQLQKQSCMRTENCLKNKDSRHFIHKFHEKEDEESRTLEERNIGEENLHNVILDNGIKSKEDFYSICEGNDQLVGKVPLVPVNDDGTTCVIDTTYQSPEVNQQHLQHNDAIVKTSQVNADTWNEASFTNNETQYTDSEARGQQSLSKQKSIFSISSSTIVSWNIITSTLLLVLFFFITYLPFAITRVLFSVDLIAESEETIVYTALLTVLGNLVNPIIILGTRKKIKQRFMKLCMKTN